MAFFAAHPISNVNLHNGITSVGPGAFVACNLEFVYIPDSVTEIKDAAFTQCLYLTEFRGKFATEDGLALIVDGTFHAFANGSGITEYTIPEGVATIGECAFNKAYSLKSVTIPDSVTTIGNGAFRYCSSLTSVTIPDSVTSIGKNAFQYCSSLTSVYCKATTPPALGGTSVFDNNGSGRKIYVPAGSTSAYKSAQGWSEYADDIVGYNF